MENKVKVIIRNLEKRIDENENKRNFCRDHNFTLEVELHNKIETYLKDLRFEIMNKFDL